MTGNPRAQLARAQPRVGRRAKWLSLANVPGRPASAALMLAVSTNQPPERDDHEGNKRPSRSGCDIY